MTVLCATFYVYSEVQLKFIRFDAILGPAAPDDIRPQGTILEFKTLRDPIAMRTRVSIIAVKGGCKISLNMIKDHVWACNKDEYNKPYVVIENT